MNGLSASCSSLLLLGEGNFSFARSLSQKLSDRGRNVSITATSYEKEDAVVKRNNGSQNIDALKQNGVTCLFGVDATQLHTSPLLEGREFQGIIFNFPHIPGKANITKNRDLLRSFFKSGAQKLSPAGQVLVTLCNGQGGTPADNPQREPQNSWQIVAMAAYGDLILTQTVPFRAGEYREYDATGYKGQDKGFLTEGAITHVFEKSPPIQDHLSGSEKFSAIIDGQAVDFHCPGDLQIFMTRSGKHQCVNTQAMLLNGHRFIQKRATELGLSAGTICTPIDDPKKSPLGPQPSSPPPDDKDNRNHPDGVSSNKDSSRR